MKQASVIFADQWPFLPQVEKQGNVTECKVPAFFKIATLMNHHTRIDWEQVEPDPKKTKNAI